VKYFLLALILVSTPALAGKIKGERFPQMMELPYHHPRSMIGQDPITADEVNMCADLQWQADWGPLSHRRNMSGSIGTCSPKAGVCAVYWLDTGLCDILDTATVATHRQPRPKLTKQQRIQQLEDAIDHCYSGAPKFGPQAPCEMYEKQLEEEFMK
jgi:hypothetical protein